MFISLLMCIIYTPDMGYGYIDSIFWMPFYAFGAICFSALNKTYEGIKQCWSGKYRLLFWGGYVIVTLYATTVFFGGVGFFFKNADAYFYRVMCYLIIPGILSVWLVVTSFFIPQSVTLCELGRNTLVLCGTESIVKSLAYFMNMLGFAVGPTGGGRMLLVGSFFIRNRV